MRAGSRNRSVALPLYCAIASLTLLGALCSSEENKSDEQQSLEIGVESTRTTTTSTGNDTSAEGPPDSHEAMNNRELKPKLTVSTRKKRSYQFLMGLVKRSNSSSYEVTSDERLLSENAPSNEAKASELLLELMVKIAENPEQWSKVHDLLQKIDKDLVKSKQIIDSMRDNTKVDAATQPPHFRPPSEAVKWVRNNTTEDLSNHDRHNVTKDIEASQLAALESNRWHRQEDTETTKFPWQAPTKPSKSAYQKNFAYHRVTGNPLVHTSFNKNPKAYIAVSVIAPKPMQTSRQEEDLTLENELKELKPWTHQQNLKNMAQIRSRWVIQSNDKKSLYSP